jgi:hypothetical protein
MQHTPDKEFDNLFKDKFRDAEIEPSANLWANIERELEPKRKRIIPIYWMAAATIAVVFTAVLVFQKKEGKIYMHGQDPVEQVKTNMPVDTMATPTEETQQGVEQMKPMVAKTQVKSLDEVPTKQEVAPKIKVIENNSQNIQMAVQPNTPAQRLPIKQQDPKPIDVLPVKAQQENQTVIADAGSNGKLDGDVTTEAIVQERKGIRNVGDLVNYVVEKVDKRDKKLVRFNTDDDDNSSLIGINIGFLKFNKKNKDK